jgi:hypothetical protein
LYDVDTLLRCIDATFQSCVSNHLLQESSGIKLDSNIGVRFGNSPSWITGIIYKKWLSSANGAITKSEHKLKLSGIQKPFSLLSWLTVKLFYY